ncbi:CRISPR-associated endonuclease Cas6 [Bernardetia litoralis]|uniref:CRISPR-associated endonuclease Cas6 n=1 Tax=Bernardetia litoralis TaxID=999 RepID=UPI0009DA197B|nr:CRISPR-associated endonuclease Cas6 [Bernardetia litoralis]
MQPLPQNKYNKKCILKLLRVHFNVEIAPYEVAAFRGAIIEKVGLENDLFHNHINNKKDKNGSNYAYRYPRIQYKRIGKQPVILCVGDGVEEIHKFFEQKNWDIYIGKDLLEMRIAKLDLNEFEMRVSERMNYYSIRNWVALNQQAYNQYQKLDGIVEKIAFLEKKLIGNILAFAKGIGWHIEENIELKITDLPQNQLISYKKQRLETFHVDFKTNVFLPQYIGLGAKTSVGMGTVFLKK